MPEAGFTNATSPCAPSGIKKQSRVEAHILVCFLAYVLWKTLEQWQACAGLGNSPRTILDELGASKALDVAPAAGRGTGW